MKMTQLMVFIMLALYGFSSCEKEDVKLSSTESAENHSIALKECGDDDEDPIIQGLVIENGQTADTILTGIIPQHSQTPTCTTEDNGFELRVPEGIYYFEIALNGGTPVYTGDYDFDRDTIITIYYDSL